jgi:serine protease Do
MGMQDFVKWSRNRKPLASLLIISTLAVGIMIGTLVSGHVGASRAVFETGAKPLVVPDPVIMSNTFSGIVVKLQPAVVHISTTTLPPAQTQKGRGPHVRIAPAQPNNNNNNDPNSLQDFFDKFFDGQDQGQFQQQPERALGSGVIVDSKGYILTNNHVVDGATRIQVRLNGENRQYDAKVIGTDEETDLAVIKIEASHDLPVAKLGNSDGVQVGDWVLAIGSPFDLDATVTAGIISAKDRDNIAADSRSRHQFQRFLQTDAAINPGNSGGPLVDMAGQVIGINTAILTGARSTGNEGVGFALPSNMAINVYNQIISKGHVTRGSIGITFLPDDSTNPIALRSLGAESGIILGSVEKNGPAEKAGLKPEDVITKINGKSIRTGNDLVDPIADTPVGDKVQLTYLRNKQPREVTVVVGDRAKIFPTEAADNSNEDKNQNEPVASTFGIHVEDLTSDLAHRVNADVKQGVFVDHIDPTSFAEDINMRPGDIIVAVNDQPIATVADYRKAIGALKPGQEVLFKVLESSGSSNGAVTRLLGGVVPAASN